MGDTMYETAIEILKKLEECGKEAYIVGGYPRNRLLNIESIDIDLCTSARPEEIRNLFEIKKDHHEYGSMTIFKNGYTYEITTFRKDSYDKSRYPKIEYIASIKEDLKRRDFVMNTLLINSKGEYIDFLGARNDITRKIIRSIQNPNIMIKEDPIRILRAIRFSINLDFEIDEKLKNSIKNNLDLLKTITNHRFQEEWKKIKNQEHAIIKELDIVR